MVNSVHEQSRFRSYQCVANLSATWVQMRNRISDGGRSGLMERIDVYGERLGCPIYLMSCTVHQLQLCVRSALETLEVKDLITKCKNISEHFSRSQIALDELTKIKTEQLNQPALRFIQDCVTRSVLMDKQKFLQKITTSARPRGPRRQFAGVIKASSITRVIDVSTATPARTMRAA
ncbi:hypothetical protein EVAR_38699_1 [Eumeta japonica]|uniref:Uncharacterized protein n=1 Tax=Eumeta variegata TaxID=151549 RepID=A0A4C1XMH3_EUMVA|nr:hypothetical protein EVAR_38699_1 [Eumeta japonica]